jgi:hypothetical protein
MCACVRGEANAHAHAEGARSHPSDPTRRGLFPLGSCILCLGSPQANPDMLRVLSRRAAGGLLSRAFTSGRARAATFGVVLDVDGVLVKGGTPIEGAKETLMSLSASQVRAWCPCACPEVLIQSAACLVCDANACHLPSFRGVLCDHHLAAASVQYTRAPPPHTRAPTHCLTFTKLW